MITATHVGGHSSAREAEGEIRMERNEVYGLSTPNQAQGSIETKKTAVYGMMASDLVYDTPK